MSRKLVEIKCNPQICRLLIELVRGMELIYNHNHLDYKNRPKRDKVWMSIRNVINESFCCNWNVGDCKNKWRGLRDSFVRHVRNKELRGIESGFKYSKQLEFLLQFQHTSKPYTETMNIASEDDTIASTTTTTDDQQSDDMIEVEIIKCDSSDPIHIDETEYVDVADYNCNEANSNDISFSLPAIAMPSAAQNNLPTITNANTSADQIGIKSAQRHIPLPIITSVNGNFDQSTMTSIPPPPNHINPTRNQTQSGQSLATEADDHEIFGELVVREMRKMTPEAKKTFKRDVTQLLYS